MEKRPLPPSHLLRIMLVDDDAMLRKMVARQLEAHAVRNDLAVDVREADSVSQVAKTLDGYHPHAVLTDFNLGKGGTGAQVVDTVRSHANGAHALIQGMSGGDIEQMQKLVEIHNRTHPEAPPMDFFPSLSVCLIWNRFS
ncbi:MAG: response regulator [Candidatus Micrarchaeota archaeon]|nr:response regulator [Candidatus Micrarchaeota archaeon]